MKCMACGYKHKETVSGEVISDGEKPFVQLINSFHTKEEDGTLDEIYLFACPQCGTVKGQPWQ